MNSSNVLTKLYIELLLEYGDPVNYWPQWCSANKSNLDREKIIIGMILVQRTTWHNANIALKNLKNANLLSIKKIAGLKDAGKLTDFIRPAGFFQSKPQRLIDTCLYVKNSGGVSCLINKNSIEIRDELLKIKGVGKETADTILLYALDKPAFIIDEYTYRFSEKNNLNNKRDYDLLQHYFQTQLESDFVIYQKFHALIIISQRGREKSLMEVV